MFRPAWISFRIGLEIVPGQIWKSSHRAGAPALRRQSSIDRSPIRSSGGLQPLACDPKARKHRAQPRRQYRLRRSGMLRRCRQAGCLHTSIKTGSGKQAARTPAFKWVNTALGNIKAALVGTYRAVREKHVPRYLAEFEYRFNRRYDLQTMIPRLAFVALRTTPMPYRLLKLADVAA